MARFGVRSGSLVFACSAEDPLGVAVGMRGSLARLRDLDSHRPQGLRPLDERDYPKKILVTDEQLAAVNLKGQQFHPEWNYTIAPTPTDTTKPPH